MKAWQTKLLDDLKAQYGDILPYWVVYPDIHPYSIGWRMGGGESCRDAWWAWWQTQEWTFDEKVAYFKKFGVPHAWLGVLLDILYEVDYHECDEDELPAHFAKLHALGFGSYEEWQTDFDDERWD